VFRTLNTVADKGLNGDALRTIVQKKEKAKASFTVSQKKHAFPLSVAILGDSGSFLGPELVTIM
jgi:hypothetical protein